MSVFGTFTQKEKVCSQNTKTTVENYDQLELELEIMVEEL